MKLATYQDGSRDGQLVVVSEDLEMAHFVSECAHTLRQLLEDWNFIYPQLQDISQSLNQGKARHAFPFNPQMCMAPLPRTFQRLGFDAFSEVNEANLGMVQLPSDALLGPTQHLSLQGASGGLDFEAQLSVITTDVPQGTQEDEAVQCIRLLMLTNAVQVRTLESSSDGASSLAQGSSAHYSAVAITTDELGEAWRAGRLEGVLHLSLNGKKVGLLDTGHFMRHGFGRLIEHAAKTRPLSAGTVIGSGAIMNLSVNEQGKAQWPNGFSSLAQKRHMESLEQTVASTEFLKAGDVFKAELKMKSGHSVFGAIEQQVA
jgi:fumarylacetoacetate (FAA) hydrolase